MSEQLGLLFLALFVLAAAAKAVPGLFKSVGFPAGSE